MTSSPRTPELSSTPALAALLARLRRRLLAQIWLHGLGGMAVVLGLWLAFVFLADWALHVPLAVRWFHLAVLVALPVVLFWREVLRHLRRVPDKAGLALLIERAHPELHELLVSAVQLQGRGADAGNAELVQRVLRDAELRATQLSLAGVLDERPQQVRAAVGVLVICGVALGVATRGEMAGIFLQRLIGADVPWPQRTTLELAFATEMEHAQVRTTPEGLEARVARGSDVPLVVRAIGELPEEVVLHFKGGSEAVLSAASDGTFRTLLRSCQEDLELYVTGGDDEDGLPRLVLSVLDPPDVAALAVLITPPDYTGAAERLEFDRDVQVLAGSRLRIAILPTPADATGFARILPADQRIELSAAQFPARDPASPTPGAGLGFEFVATQSLRYRFELRDSTGLSDPDPGLFSVDVVTDDRPEVELISPARLDLETVAGGALRLTARAVDDFGISELAWRSRSMAGEQRNGEWRALSTRPAPMPLRGDEAQRGVAVAGTARLEISAFALGGAQPAEGDLFELDVRALDTRPALAGAPDPAGSGASPAVRVRIVGEDELLRRLQDRLSKTRGQVADLDVLVRKQLTRTRDVLAALESGDDAPPAADLASLLVGERRALGDSEALTRELCGALEGVLYARIDDKAGALLEALDAELAKALSKGFPLEAWRAFADSLRSGRLSAQGLSGQLTGLFDLALRISAEDLPQAVEALDGAGRRTDVGEVHAELSAALQREESAQQHLAELLDRLAEWDNFQSILSLARDILGRQKSVRDKTAEMSGK